MKRLTAEWVEKAERDFAAAQLVAGHKNRSHDIVCFHCQQAAEKYLKALLQEQNTAFPRTHDLITLLPLVSSAHRRRLRRLRRGLDYLTQFAVDPRYPLMWPSKRQAQAALRWAGRVRDACRSIMGI